MPNLNELHRRLSLNAGTWEGVESMFPSSWDPEGGEALARIQSRPALDGFALIGDYEQRRGGQVTFRGHSVWTVDPANGDVILTWFDSIGTLPETFRGKFEGNTIQVTSKSEHGWNRLTYYYDQPNVMTSRMEMSPDGNVWSPLFEGRYSRVAE
jgi:hypothetical protein